MAEDTVVISGSILGQRGDNYSDQEKMWISIIANRLRDRERSINCMNREDMGLYVIASGLLYELAKKLDQASSQSRFGRKTMDHWLRIVTGMHFDFITQATPGVGGYQVIEVGDTTAFKSEKKEE